MAVSPLFSFVCFFLSLINLLRGGGWIDSPGCLRACVCRGAAFPAPERDNGARKGPILARGGGLSPGWGAVAEV